MSLDGFSQIAIAVSGCIIISLLSRKDKWTGWGHVVGTLFQPFWVYTTVVHKQWGLLLLTFFYWGCYSKGVYNYFFRKQDDA